MQRIWVTGYCSYELNIFQPKDPKIKVIKAAVKKELQQKIENGLLDWVISGGNLGVEQWTLETALQLKHDYDIQVAMMTPFLDFEKNWQEDKQLQYQQLKDKVDFFATTSNQPYQNFMQLKNYQSFMINHTDEALMVYDTEHPGKPKYDYEFITSYQATHTYSLTNLDFYDLEDVANVIAEEKHWADSE